jgi:hypothetical protein
MNWTLLVTKPAQKDLERVLSKDQVRLESALDALRRDPFSGDIKRLQPPVGAGVSVITVSSMICISTSANS